MHQRPQSTPKQSNARPTDIPRVQSEDLHTDQSLTHQNDKKPSPKDFIAYIKYACEQLQVPMTLLVDVTYEEDLRKSPKNKSKSKTRDSAGAAIGDPNASLDLTTSRFSGDPHYVNIKCCFNYSERLQRLELNEPVPRKLVKVIGLIAFFHPDFYSVLLKGAHDQFTIHEISSFIYVSNITEVVFDGVSTKHGNFYEVLNDPGHLNSLTIARCSINDLIVKEIVDRIKFGTSGGRTLQYLNLTSNFITDEGAKYFGELLKMNRKLCYLNLSGNQLTDVGVISILKSLLQFKISGEELYKSRNAHLNYATRKRELLMEYIEEGKLEGVKSEDLKNKRKTVTKKPLKEKTSLVMTVDQMLSLAEQAFKYPAFDHPYKNSKLVFINNEPYCLGNNTLQCLNVAYNSITNVSLKIFLQVLKHQCILKRTPTGLVRICVEGNPLSDCDEISFLNYFLDSFLSSRSKSNLRRKKS